MEYVLAHFIKAEDEENRQPNFPFLCLLVSGGNSQIILVKAYNDMEILGQTQMMMLQVKLLTSAPK